MVRGRTAHTASVELPDKRTAILHAALELAAEQGLQHAPMSLIAKRARASAGIIYHYFASKQELLASLYYTIKSEMARAIIAADDPGQAPAERFQRLWLSIFRYCGAHPQELAFLEQYESAPAAPGQQAWMFAQGATLDDLIRDVTKRKTLDGLPPETQVLIGLIADLRAQNLIKDLPVAAVGEFTLGVAMRLARQAAEGKIKLDDATLAAIAQASWAAIAR